MHIFRDLAAVMVRPRATMRRILDAPSARVVLLLFVVESISGIFGDLDLPMLKQLAASSRIHIALLMACVILGVVIATVAIAWFYSWVPYLAGKFLGGTGDIRGVRAAIAWGLTPAIWALLYRVPAAIWLAPSSASNVRMRSGDLSFDPGRLADGCGIALILGLVEFAMFVWCACVMSNTVGEAHGFSAWHGLGTLAISAIAPFVVLLAAVLAMH